MGNENQETIDYRLSNIEKTLAELKDVLVENKIMSRDLADLKNDMIENRTAINKHEQRIRDLEFAPQKAKAEKWTQIVDMIFKAVITIVITVVFAKIGLKV